jgi:hypothetical protein
VPAAFTTPKDKVWNLKIGASLVFGVWSLEFLWCLVFGVWSFLPVLSQIQKPAHANAHRW